WGAVVTPLPRRCEGHTGSECRGPLRAKRPESRGCSLLGEPHRSLVLFLRLGGRPGRRAPPQSSRAGDCGQSTWRLDRTSLLTEGGDGARLEGSETSECSEPAALAPSSAAKLPRRLLDGACPFAVAAEEQTQFAVNRERRTDCGSRERPIPFSARRECAHSENPVVAVALDPDAAGGDRTLELESATAGSERRTPINSKPNSATPPEARVVTSGPVTSFPGGRKEYSLYSPDQQSTKAVELRPGLWAAHSESRSSSPPPLCQQARSATDDEKEMEALANCPEAANTAKVHKFRVHRRPASAKSRQGDVGKTATGSLETPLGSLLRTLALTETGNIEAHLESQTPLDTNPEDERRE
ncbi:hypothetical protein HPB47_004507, partial [Ixodes persulcatus]